MKILDVPQSGSLAGQTSSRNRFGQYRRTRAIPVNTNTTSQQARRNAFAENSAQWRAITDAQRSAWEAYAASRPKNNSLGATIILTGAQTFVGVNSALMAAFLDPVTDPPSLVVPAAPTISMNTAEPDNLSVAYTPDPVPADTSLVIECSRPLSPGITFNKEFRIVTITVAAGTSPADITEDYTNKFGVPQSGTRIFVRAYLIKETGERSEPVTLSFIVE